MGSLHFAVLVLAVSAVTALTFPNPIPEKDKRHDHNHKKHDSVCHDFSKGVQYRDHQAVGTWHLLAMHVQERGADGATDGHCLQFTPTTAEERKTVSDKVGQYVENLNWDNLTLKMEIPCSAAKSNHTRVFFLERLADDGSYRTLQIPATYGKPDLAQVHRYPMRFKPIEDQYLALMDCHEKYVFLLGKHTPKGKVDERLKQMINVYWPGDDE